MRPRHALANRKWQSTYVGLRRDKMADQYGRMGGVHKICNVISSAAGEMQDFEEI
jgi:hypothetical protein